MHVVATAGHVDHGKSTLLRALTGMEPDRWAEERRRGLTIDLGFVWTTLDTPDAPTVAFVDVPGHERFVANMLAGAGAVRLALLVVAADDGWSAQSQEHLDILDLLGVGAAVVAVSKTDLAGDERAAAVAADVDRRLATTTLAGAPIVLTDAESGRGLDELVTVLARRLAETPAPVDEGRARLWVDRSFTIAGAGTVVTGTLAGGALAVGDDIVLAPAGRVVRVRGLHALGERIERAPAGSRVAVNLVGVDREDVGRGDALLTPASDPVTAWLLTDRVDAWVKALPNARIGRKGAWHLHVGSAEVGCRIEPLLGAPVDANAPGYVRITLAQELPLQVGDHFVLREAGRAATLGGGEVVDPLATLRVRGREPRRARAAQLDAIRSAAGTGPRLTALVAAAGGALPLATARAAAGATDAVDVPDALRVVGHYAVTAAIVERAAAAVVAAASAHHDHDPESPGAGRDALVHAVTDAVTVPPQVAAAVVEDLVQAGRLRRLGTAFALPERSAAVDAARSQRRSALLARLEEEPLSPPRLEDAAREVGIGYAEVQGLLQDGTIVRCGELGFTADAVADAIVRLRELYASTGPFTAAQAKDAWGTTRRSAIPLLEHLDAIGVTRFDGRLRRMSSDGGS